MVKKITEKEFSEVEAAAAAVIDFSAGWCGPCQMLAPVLDKVSEEMDGKAAFFNVDVDSNPGLAQRFGIMNIPALVLLKKGAQEDILVGFRPKEELSAWIEGHL